jgi:hypothetical protein
MRAAAPKKQIARRAQAIRAEEFRVALDRTLEIADADERIGPMIAATRLRMCLRFPDAGFVLHIAAGVDGDNIRWSFAEVDWPAKVELIMDSVTANRYLQGRQSLAIAIARGQARYRGESRSALVGLPAARLLCEPYREVIRSEFPQLADQPLESV